MNKRETSSETDWIHPTTVKRINEWLTKPYSDLVFEIEQFLSIGSASRKTDDYFDLLERWIRKRIRTWGGGDLGEFVVINPHLMTGKWRTDSYLQDIFRVFCNNSSVRSFHLELTQYPPVEQIVKISNFLRDHPSMTKSRFTRRGAWDPTATLIYRIGLDNILDCNHHVESSVRH